MWVSAKSNHLTIITSWIEMKKRFQHVKVLSLTEWIAVCLFVLSPGWFKTSHLHSAKWHHMSDWDSYVNVNVLGLSLHSGKPVLLTVHITPWIIGLFHSIDLALSFFWGSSLAHGTRTCIPLTASSSNGYTYAYDGLGYNYHYGTFSITNYHPLYHIHSCSSAYFLFLIQCSICYWTFHHT